MISKVLVFLYCALSTFSVRQMAHHGSCWMTNSILALANWLAHSHLSGNQLLG